MVLARFISLTLNATAVALLTIWMFLFFWEAYRHEILLEDYLAALPILAALLLVARKIIVGLISKTDSALSRRD